MKTETPITESVVKTSLEKGDDALTEDLLFHSRKMEVLLAKATVALYACANRKTIGDELNARKLVEDALKSINVAAMPNDPKLSHGHREPASETQKPK